MTGRRDIYNKGGNYRAQQVYRVARRFHIRFDQVKVNKCFECGKNFYAPSKSHKMCPSCWNRFNKLGYL